MRERRRTAGQSRRMLLPLLASAAIVAGGVAVTVTLALAHHAHSTTAASAARTQPGGSAGVPDPGPESALTSPMPKASDRAAVKPHPKSASAQPPPRASNCGPDPHLCGFPDATNTGVPAGMNLVSVPAQASHGPGWSSDAQGNVTVFGAGAVFAGYSVHGVVTVTGSSATVRDDSIVNSGTDINGDGVNLSGNPSNVTIEDVTMASPNGASGNGLFAGIKDINGEAMGTRVLDNNIADASTGVQIYIGVIQDNYIHNITPAAPGSHLNGTTSNGSTVPLTIQHNTVFNPNGQTDAVSLFEDFGVEANVVINDNLLAGGGYTIYGGQNAGGPQAYNIKITNNRISTIYFPQGGFYGYITAFNPSAPGNVWSGNVWDATGKPVSA